MNADISDIGRNERRNP